MSVKVSWVAEQIEKIAPKNYALDWDANIGLQVGSLNYEVEKVLVALDLTQEVLEEAIENKVGLIVTHHQLLTKPTANITEETVLGKKIIELITNKISIYAAHTNLDMAEGGTNDELFDRIGLINKQPLMPEENGNHLGRIGELESPISLIHFARLIKKKLNIENVSIVGDTLKLIKTVGLCTGGGSSSKYFLEAKRKGCDAYISGDLTYHDAQVALEEGIALIDATHFATEVIIVDKLCKIIKEAVIEQNKTLEVIKSKKSKQPIIIV